MTRTLTILSLFLSVSTWADTGAAPSTNSTNNLANPGANLGTVAPTGPAGQEVGPTDSLHPNGPADRSAVSPTDDASNKVRTRSYKKGRKHPTDTTGSSTRNSTTTPSGAGTGSSGSGSGMGGNP